MTQQNYRLAVTFSGDSTQAVQASGAVADALAKVEGQAQAAQAAAAKVGQSVGQMGQAAQVSAAQTAAAMRQLPAQFTDIVTSLQGGQSPLTVLLQQGGQIKDSFGGVRAALTGVGRALGPVLLNPITAVAAGVALVGLAAIKGAAEAQEFARSITMTGNAAGVTVGQLALMADRIDGIGGTKGNAAEVLANLAGTAGITAGNIERIATAAILMERAGGPAAAKTAQQFAELGKAPLEAAIRLNEQVNFLTASTYAQIKALNDQGRTAEAAALAQNAYAATITQRAAELEQGLGILERAWRGIKDGAKEAWDAMLNIGRPDSVETSLQRVQEQIIQAQRDMADARSDNKGRYQEQLDSLRLQEASLQQQVRLAAQSAANRAKAAAQVRAQADWDKEGARYLSDQIRMQQEITQARNLGLAAGRSQVEIEQRIADITAKYAPKGGKSAAETQLERERAAAKDWAQAWEEVNKIRLEAEGKTEQLTKAEAALVRIMGSSAYLNASEAMRRLILDELQAAMVAEDLTAQQKLQAEAVKAAAKARGDMLAVLERGATTAQAEVQRMRDEAEAAKLAAAQNITLAQAVLQVQIARLRERQMGALGDEGAVLAIEREIQARRTLLGLTAGADARNGVASFLSGDVGGQLADGFDRASQSLSAFVTNFAKLVDLEAAYRKARADAGNDADALAKVEARNMRNQVNAYGTLAGAAKGFFREGSKGYKTLEAAEKSARAVELALAIETAMTKIGLLGTVASAKVATDATMAASDTARAGVEQGNSITTAAVKGAEAVVNAIRSMPFPLNIAAGAATAAAILSLGVRLTGGRSAPGAMPTNTGTGTVMGDRSAQSESIARSIDELRDVDTMTMRYSAQMLDSLRSIESSIGGLANLVLRSTGISGSGAGIVEGFSRSGVGNLLGGASDFASGLAATIPIFGSLLSRVIGGVGNAVANLFGTRTTVTGQGIYGGAQSLGGILANGYDASYYTDVTRRRRTLGVTTSTSSSTTMTEASAEIERQFALIFRNVATSVEAAAGVLGLNLEQVRERLQAYVVELGRIDLRGLTGEQIQERLASVFGAAADSIAAAAVAGLEDFQQVGEGYYETLVRVAGGVEEARAALDTLGITVVDLEDLVNRQGDVGAELVRQSLLAAEAAGSGIAQIIEVLDGGASDLAGAYRALVDVRSVLTGLGLDGSATGAALLGGAGGLSGLQDALAAFRATFLTDGERLALSTELMAQQFARLGLSMPTSAQGFVDLVRGIDTSTEAGQRLLGQVLALSDGYSELADAQRAIADERAGLERRLLELNGDTAALRALELQSLDESNRALQLRIWALEDEQERVESLARAGQSISEFVDRLRGTTATLGGARAAYERDLAAARTGDVEASGRITASAQALIDVVRSTATSPVELAQATSRIAAQLSALPAVQSYQDRLIAESSATAANTALLRDAAVATQASTSRTADVTAAVVQELQALRSAVAGQAVELSMLREEQMAAAAQLAASSQEMVKLLDRVTDGGAAMQTVVAA